MKKIIYLLILILILISCKELKRNNIYDPKSDNYIGITYKGEKSYPYEYDIIAIDNVNGVLCLAVHNDGGCGYCILKDINETWQAYGREGSAEGEFLNINDISHDNSKNLYITDSLNRFQVLSETGIITQKNLSFLTSIDKLYIEWLNNYVFLSDNKNKIIYKCDEDGNLVDSKSITITVNGEFIPGEIFKSENNIYVINEINKNEIIKLDVNLNVLNVILFTDEIIDGCIYENSLQLLNDKTVFKVDSNLNIILSWGNFGKGPGRVLNGRDITYDKINRNIIILDGDILKVFGK